MDVVALGELLIDFTENGTSAQDNKLFEANPGGAPCNVLAMLQKLGHQTAFIGKVGQDAFGRLLVDAVKEQGIDTTGVRYDDNVHTTLAFVQTAADGDRDFSFYRNPGADMMLTADEVDLSLVRNAKIFHFGSLSMTDKICENATKHAIAAAKEAGVLISFDPNLRKPLWKSMDDAKEKISWGLSQCDILKISDDEIEFMTGEKDIKTGVKKLIDEYHIPFICATMGKNGSMAFLYFCRGSMLLYGGTEFAPQHQVGLFDAEDNFGDKRADLQGFLRRCKDMKTSLPLDGAVWYEVSGGAVIGHYKSPAGERTGVFDLSGCGGRVPVELPDGVYKNQLGGDLTVTDGHVRTDGDPIVF